MAELKVESERVMAAAECWPDVKGVLMILFPEAFDFRQDRWKPPKYAHETCAGIELRPGMRLRRWQEGGSSEDYLVVWRSSELSDDKLLVVNSRTGAHWGPPVDRRCPWPVEDPCGRWAVIEPYENR